MYPFSGYAQVGGLVAGKSGAPKDRKENRALHLLGNPGYWHVSKDIPKESTIVSLNWIVSALQKVLVERRIVLSNQPAQSAFETERVHAQEHKINNTLIERYCLLRGSEFAKLSFYRAHSQDTSLSKMSYKISTVYEEVDEEAGQQDNESTYIGNNPRASILLDARPAYNYRKFIPSGRGSVSGVADSIKWLVGGVAPNGARLSEVEVEENTRQAARMLSLLREYERRFGMPEAGGARDEQWVLTELARGLYGGGTPLWTLKPVMSQAAEGLTGARGVDFALFPRTAFVCAPNSGSTLMFNMERGFNINKLTLMERVLVRMASFASNTRSVNEVDSNSPEVPQLLRASRGESVQFGRSYRKEALAKEILDLASDGFGLFYLASHAKQMQAKVGEGVNGHARESQEIQSFWTVEPSIKELFTRLATIEANASIVEIKEQVDAKPLYPRSINLLFRVISSAGASGLWFGGSWQDMIVAGLLGMMVAVFQGVSLWKHDRMILEVVASFVVGLVSGLLSMAFPSTLCFGAMAVGAVIDILQGEHLLFITIGIYVTLHPFKLHFVSAPSKLHSSSRLPRRLQHHGDHE